MYCTPGNFGESGPKTQSDLLPHNGRTTHYLVVTLQSSGQPARRKASAEHSHTTRSISSHVVLPPNNKEHFGINLESLSGHFGVTLESFLDHFGVTLGSLWDHFGIILAFGDHFGIIWGSFLDLFAIVLGFRFCIWHQFGIVLGSS